MNSLIFSTLRTAALLLAALTLPVSAATLEATPVKLLTAGGMYTAEGVVESVKTTQVAAEMQGSITMLAVKAGDTVRAGQVLARIDTRVANQQVVGTQAQAAAADAQLFAARQAFDRKKRLFEKQYISQASLEQAEAEFKVAEAQTRAQQAEISIASVKTGLHTVVAPYSGVVSEVTAELGDMAMPGKSLLVLYAPGTLRVLASVPQDRLSQMETKANVQVEIPGSTQPSFTVPARNLTILPVADAVSHQMQVRVVLPDGLKGITPGMFSRIQLAIKGDSDRARLLVPTSSVMRRGELALVYVVIAGKPQLRQVRLGQAQGAETEVLSGVEAGEQVALHPLAVGKSQK